MAEYSDEILMAYADGELDEATARQVARACEADMALKARVDAFSRTGKGLASAFDPILDAPVPRNLIDSIYQSSVSGVAAQAGAQTAGRERLSTPRPSAWARVGEWFDDLLSGGRIGGRQGLGALAASSVLALVFGTALGWGIHQGRFMPPADDIALVRVVDGALQASGGLATLLETAESGSSQAVAGSDGARASARLTFRTASGGYCRQYVFSETKGGAYEGIACRGEDGAWVIQVHAPTSTPPPLADVIVPASGVGSPLVEAVADNLIAGDVLGKAEEAKALSARWSTPSK